MPGGSLRVLRLGVVWGFVGIFPLLAVPAVNQRINQLVRPLRPLTGAKSAEGTHSNSTTETDHGPDRANGRPADWLRQSHDHHQTQFLLSVEPAVGEKKRTTEPSSQTVVARAPWSRELRSGEQTGGDGEPGSVMGGTIPAATRLSTHASSGPEHRGPTIPFQPGLETGHWPDQLAAGFGSESVGRSGEGLGDVTTEGAAGSSTQPRSSLWEPARVMAIQERLKELGARYLILENLRDRQLYRFHCRVDVGDQAVYARVFESYDTQPQPAMERVLTEVEAWIAAQRGSSPKISPDQVQPSP